MKYKYNFLLFIGINGQLIKSAHKLKWVESDENYFCKKDQS